MRVPEKLDRSYFRGKVLQTENGDVIITQDMAAQIEFYLIQNGYVDHQRQIVEKYHIAKTEDALAQLPESLSGYALQIFQLVDSVFSEEALAQIVDDGRKPKTNPLNDNFEKQAFKDLWKRINKKAVYRVDFDGDELVDKCIQALNKELTVAPLKFTVQIGTQENSISADQLSEGKSFKTDQTRTEYGRSAFEHKYDLLHEISQDTQLTRQTVANILSRIEAAVFDNFKRIPSSSFLKRRDS